MLPFGLPLPFGCGGRSCCGGRCVGCGGGGQLVVAVAVMVAEVVDGCGGGRWDIGDCGDWWSHEIDGCEVQGLEP